MAGFEIGRRETLLSERKIHADEPDESQGRHRFETPKPLTIYEVRLTRLLRGAGARRFGVYCGDRGIGYSSADPHPGPLPSDGRGRGAPGRKVYHITRIAASIATGHW